MESYVDVSRETFWPVPEGQGRYRKGMASKASDRQRAERKGNASERSERSGKIPAIAQRIYVTCLREAKQGKFPRGGKMEGLARERNIRIAFSELRVVAYGTA